MSTTVYRARRLIDGISEAPLAEAVLVLEDGMIAAVGQGLPVPDRAKVHDLGDATLLPGLVDCHLHLPFDGSADPLASFAWLSVAAAVVVGLKNAQRLLRMGITTVRDVSTPHGISIGLRDAIDAGVARGPRILAAGTHICMSGGHGASFGLEADGPDEIRKAVRSQIKEGADFVKIMGTGGVYSLRQQPGAVQLFLDELKAAVETAHMAGCKVACHAEGEEGIRLALKAGVDTIEHGNLLTPELAEEMAGREVFLVPTAIAFKKVVESPNIPAAYIAKGRRMLEASYRCLRLAKEFGVKVAAGSDSGTGINLSWDDHSFVQELTLYLEVGNFPPMDVLKSATSMAARALGVEQVTGSLEPGKAADVVAVAGNPLENLAALKNPLLVLKGGQPVPLTGASGGAE